MPSKPPVTLEICVDDVAGIAACQDHADRIELCSALALGGLTPGPGLIACASQSSVPIHAMIRPRAGGFIYSETELSVMETDIKSCVGFGLAGVVFGATTKDRTLDIPALKRLHQAAENAECTLHRAIDTLRDPLEAVRIAIDLGFRRILTSGGAHMARDGVEKIAKMIVIADDQIEIMVGSGLTANNIATVQELTGASMFHASASTTMSTDPSLVQFGFISENAKYTDATKIVAMRKALDIHA